MKITTIFAVLIACIISAYATPSNATAVVLGTHGEGSSGGFAAIATEVDFGFGYVLGGVYPIELISWTVSPEDVGDTFHIYDETDPDFDFMASMLTNGANDEIAFFTLGSAHGWNDYLLAGGDIDFYGYTITSISLTVDFLSLTSPGRNPNGDGIWTDFNYDVTYKVWGVPEPSTLFPLALGGLVLLRKRRA